jgi:hypothetical protein
MKYRKHTVLGLILSVLSLSVFAATMDTMAAIWGEVN